MTGTANTCDKDKLTPGAPCIIEMDRTVDNTELWWGEVVSVKKMDRYISIEAMIFGGRFCLSDAPDREPIKSDENNGQIPGGTYRVYPDTESMRRVFGTALQLKKELQGAKAETTFMKQIHFDMMEHLLRKKLIAAQPKDQTDADNSSDKTPPL